MRCITRRLLVRLNIIFDYQISFFVHRDFEEFTLASAGLNFPDRDFCLEATLYMLYLATDIEHPSTLGQSDFSLHRGLIFAGLLSVFRTLCLHRTSFTDEEDKIIRQRVGHFCQTWDAQKPLSDVEQQVLRQLIPQTLGEVRATNGDWTLQTFCRGQCAGPSYHQGHVRHIIPTQRMPDYLPFVKSANRDNQAAICIDPSSPQYRSDSLRCCQIRISLNLLC